MGSLLGLVEESVGGGRRESIGCGGWGIIVIVIMDIFSGKSQSKVDIAQICSQIAVRSTGCHSGSASDVVGEGVGVENVDVSCGGRGTIVIGVGIGKSQSSVAILALI